MKPQKIAILFPLAVMAVGALAGCDGARVDPYSVDLSIDISGANISFWGPFGADNNAIVEELIGEFEEQTGVDVAYESKGSYDQLKQAIDLSATSRTYPHVALGYPDHFAGYVRSNIIVRLDYYFENGDTYDYGEYDEADRSFTISDFYEDYMVENQSIEMKNDSEGWTLGVPFNKSTEIMTINKTFFDWAVTVDSEITVPTTWEEVGVVGPKITTLLTPFFGKVIGSDNQPYDDAQAAMDAGKTVVLDLTNSTADLFRPLSYDSQANLFITTVRQNGGTYTEIDYATGKGYLAYNSQETVAGLQVLRDLFDDRVLGVPKLWEESKYSSGPFKDVMAVMAIGSTAGVQNNAPAGNKFTLSAAPVPYSNAERKYVISQGTNLALLDRGTEKERVAAWRLLQYLSKYANAEFAQRSGYFPSCAYAENDEDYQDFLANPGFTTTERIKAEVAKVNSNVYIDDAQNWIKFVDAPFVGSAYVRNEIASIPEALFFTTATIQAILDASYANMPEYVRP
ncbi:MAG: extracellular solute-binding protein [Erysipelotrichia bacterium]|jgi:ABC-type glycerol-3-phosphate transport system substrate-binding protein|nr:extracellular solute-binding protein [Erysipelotrichia bacterium]